MERGIRILVETHGGGNQVDGIIIRDPSLHISETCLFSGSIEDVSVMTVLAQHHLMTWNRTATGHDTRSVA